MKSVEINFEIGSSDVKMLSIHHKRKKNRNNALLFLSADTPIRLCIHALYVLYISGALYVRPLIIHVRT